MSEFEEVTRTAVAALMSRRFRGFLPVVIDVETGGFNSRTDALLEIAAVFIDIDASGTLSRGCHPQLPCAAVSGCATGPGLAERHRHRSLSSVAAALPEREAIQRIFREVRHQLKAYDCRPGDPGWPQRGL